MSLTQRTTLSRWLLAASLLLSSACATILSGKPEAPTVTVTRVVPLSLSLSKSKLNLTLRVENPNGFDLPIQTIDFIAYFSGTQIANGNSTEAVTIPANSEALLDISVEAGLSKIWNQFKTMFDEQKFELKYAVTGAVKLANWPARIPFNVEKTLLNPTAE